MANGRHSFYVDLVSEIGFEAAMLLEYIYHWCCHNKNNNQNLHEGFYWTYESQEGLSKNFKYLTVSKIKTAMNILKKNEYIKTGNFNKKKYDRTTWYTVTPDGVNLIRKCAASGITSTWLEDTIVTQNSLAKNEHSFGESFQCISEKSLHDQRKIANGPANFSRPIPITNTITNTITTSHSVQSKEILNESEIFEQEECLRLNQDLIESDKTGFEIDTEIKNNTVAESITESVVETETESDSFLLNNPEQSKGLLVFPEESITVQDDSQKEKPRQKKKGTGTFPAEAYNCIVELYRSNRSRLFQKGLVSHEDYELDIKAVRGAIKKAFTAYGVEKVTEAMKDSLHIGWLYQGINDYNFFTIFSAKVMTDLINKSFKMTEQQKQQQTYFAKKNANQVVRPVADWKSFEENDFFAGI